ncbi:MAG TPA: GAF domain-containing sensor histidine kinase, partial [Thermoanaerobaculia bacterium]|nr:GAF domain-containing sensor histidine kinase [Thermoanaerobaculia bacterium]
QRRSAFLAEASSVLASSLDYKATLATVARLAVPGMADWCVVDVVDEQGKLQRLAVAHADPAKVAWLSELRERYPEDPSSPYGAAEVLRTGNPQVLTEIPDSLLRSSAHDEEHYRILSELGLNSFLSVPLEAAGRRIGVLTLVSAESGFRYGPDDVAFARRLAHHASLAIDNSRLYEEAQAAVAARDDFLSIASHELKTPVATLQLLIQNLMRRIQTDPSSVSPAAASERLIAVDKQVLRLTKLINDLLDLSRITDGRMELDLEPADLAAIARDVVVRHEEDARRAHCTVSVVAESPAQGVWDPMRVDQVVENLLSNAIKYGARGPIEVRVDGDDRVARLTVRDEGIGIAPDAQARIFQRFERAVSTSDYGGFGLGLWIVHQIVSAHSGELRVESEPGRGSTFHVALPRTPPEPEPAEPGSPGYTDGAQ